MGSPKPTYEELKFIYQRFVEGIENEDKVLDLLRVYREKNPNISPVRRDDKRFVIDRRKEFHAAREVLWDALKNQADPLIVENKRKHFEQLANIISGMLKNGLGNICQRGEDEYFVGEEDLTVLTRSEVEDRLYKNDWGDECDAWFYHNCLIPHLKAEQLEVDGVDFLSNVTDLVGFFEALNVLSRRNTFKGTCPVCKDW